MTGIVRRIDELGRIVIPKEMRRTMRIRDGERLEIIAKSKEEIAIRKYSTMENAVGVMRVYADVLSEMLGGQACILDRSTLLAVSRKEITPEPCSAILATLIDNGREGIYDMQITANSAALSGVYLIPIVSEGKSHGGIVLSRKPDDNGMIALKIICECIIRQLD